MSSLSQKDLLNKITIPKLKELATEFEIYIPSVLKKDAIIEKIIQGYSKLNTVNQTRFENVLNEKINVKSVPKKRKEDASVKELSEEIKRMTVAEEPVSSRRAGAEEPSSSRQLQKREVSPTSERFRRNRGAEYKEDVSTRSSRRYLLPARLPGFRNFLCNMLEYRGEMKSKMTFYPIGYISYLLRAYSYDTGSIIPLNVSNDDSLKPLLESRDGIELNEAINFGNKEFRALYVKESKNNMIYPATIIYNSREDTSCIYVKKDLPSLISNINATHRFIIIFVREITVDGNGRITRDTYLPFFIDQKSDRKTIDILAEYDMRPNDMIEKTRMEALSDLFDTKGYTIRNYKNVPAGTDSRVWQIMMTHLKLINQKDPFEDIEKAFIDQLREENKELSKITYSYFMKITRLSTDQNVDTDLLYVFNGNQ